jgi:hypothetical protein
MLIERLSLSGFGAPASLTLAENATLPPQHLLDPLLELRTRRFEKCAELANITLISTYGAK